MKRANKYVDKSWSGNKKKNQHVAAQQQHCYQINTFEKFQLQFSIQMQKKTKLQ